LIATEEGGRRSLVNAWIGAGSRRVLKLRRDALELEASADRSGAADNLNADEKATDAEQEAEEPGPVQAAFTTGIPHIPDIPHFREQEERCAQEVMEWTAVP
jgi:hypothetical protein